jgi:uncharacterized membrane protein
MIRIEIKSAGRGVIQRTLLPADLFLHSYLVYFMQKLLQEKSPPSRLISIFVSGLLHTKVTPENSIPSRLISIFVSGLLRVEASPENSPPSLLMSIFVSGLLHT